MVVSEDRQTAIVGYYRVLASANVRHRTIKLQGLDPDMLYELRETDDTFYGDELLYRGLPITFDRRAGDFASQVWTLQMRNA